MRALENERGETILVVDDGDALRKMVCAMLAQSGYACLEASDGAEALELLKGAGRRVNLVLTDVVMPRMGGGELASHLARQQPDLRIVFMSGCADDPVVQRMERAHSFFLAKPFTAAALTEKVRQTLDGPWHGLPGVRPGPGTQ